MPKRVAETEGLVLSAAVLLTCICHEINISCYILGLICTYYIDSSHFWFNPDTQVIQWECLVINKHLRSLKVEYSIEDRIIWSHRDRVFGCFLVGSAGVLSLALKRAVDQETWQRKLVQTRKRKPAMPCNQRSSSSAFSLHLDSLKFARCRLKLEKNWSEPRPKVGSYLMMKLLHSQWTCKSSMAISGS